MGFAAPGEFESTGNQVTISDVLARNLRLSEQIRHLRAQLQAVRNICDRPAKGDTWDTYNQGYNDAIGVVEAALERETPQ